jgi:hypothetical protein
LSRDTYVSTGTGDGNGSRDQEVVEHDDHIEVNGVTIHKPFVEKPVDADDHNIAIYYPTSAGGGCKKLFRKIGNRSSEFYPDINVRNNVVRNTKNRNVKWCLHYMDLHSLTALKYSLLIF